MRKIYKKPEMLIERMLLTQVIALSIVDEPADPEEPVLGKGRKGFGNDNDEWSKKLWE